MRFVYIFCKESIFIEIQQNRNRLSPFLRGERIASQLENSLAIEEDRVIFQFIKLLNKSSPPFEIEKQFISSELLLLIEKIDFFFVRKTSKASLAKIKKAPNYKDATTRHSYMVIKPSYISIKIVQILKNRVLFKAYFEFDSMVQKIPIDYNFIVPLVNDGILATIDKDRGLELLDMIFNIIDDDIVKKEHLSFDEIRRLSDSEFIKIEYKIDRHRGKSIGFVSNSIFKIRIFEQEKLDRQRLDYYYTILKNYLQNKDYVELDDEIVILDDRDFVDSIDTATLLKTFSYDLDNSNISLFVQKIIDIKSYISKVEIVNELSRHNFKAILKNYQEDGVQWLYNLYKNNIDGGLLADEMGLGKTVQVIAFLLLVEPSSVLIIAPASLIHNWQNEFYKFTHLTKSDISLRVENVAPIMILSYEQARSKIKRVSEQKYNILIMDESQKIKNHNTQIFEAIRKINRDFTIIMTGTPIENSLSDLWNMLFSINPSFYQLYKEKIATLLNKKHKNYTCKFFQR